MLDFILSCIGSTSSTVSLPRWQQYLTLIKVKKEQHYQAFAKLRQLTIHKGTAYLLRILRIADAIELLRLGDDFYIYRTQIDNIVVSIVDSGTFALTKENFFTMPPFGSSVLDYIVFPKDNDLLKRAPFNKPYSDWKDYHPLRLYYHDSLEQTLDIASAGGIVRFHELSPTYTIWSCDIKGIILKAVAYVRNLKEQDEFNSIDFIAHELYDSILDDLLVIWFFKINEQCIKVAKGELTEEELVSRYRRTEGKYSYVGESFRPLVHDLIDLYKKVHNGSVLVKSILLLPLLGTTSFIKQISTRDRISSHTQAKALRLMFDLPYITYLLTILDLQPEHSVTVTVKRYLKQELPKWINETPYSSIRPDHLRNKIKNTLTQLQLWVNGDIQLKLD